MDFARNATGSNKRLFDPERDNPFSNPVVRKNKRLQNPRYLVGQSPMACVDFKENQLWLAVHEAVDSHPRTHWISTRICEVVDRIKEKQPQETNPLIHLLAKTAILNVTRRLRWNQSYSCNPRLGQSLMIS